MAPGALAQVLCDLPKLNNDDLLVGYEASDDACVYRINEHLASVMTVDFFTPMVDDAYLFGQIAAANALSDIYAMGAVPSHAMNILCFPSCLDISVAGDILKGGADKAAEASCAIAGGHTVTDNEPKYGLCVHGFADPAHILTNGGVKPGDALILTKPIGTGVLTTAVKGGMLGEADIDEAIECMRSLNRRSSELAKSYDVHACTDITGFGVAGHLCEMAGASDVSLVLESQSVPLLAHAREMARIGMLPGGAYRNREYFADRVDISPDVPQEISDLMFDPQTSGGLVIALDSRYAFELTEKLRSEHIEARCICHAQKKETDTSLFIR